MQPHILTNFGFLNRTYADILSYCFQDCLAGIDFQLKSGAYLGFPKRLFEARSCHGPGFTPNHCRSVKLTHRYRAPAGPGVPFCNKNNQGRRE